MFVAFLPRRFATLRITKCVKGDQGGRGIELLRGVAWQELDIAACIPEATGLISSHDNVPRNADSPPLSSIAWSGYLCRVACRVRQFRAPASLKDGPGVFSSSHRAVHRASSYLLT